MGGKWKKKLFFIKYEVFLIDFSIGFWTDYNSLYSILHFVHAFLNGKAILVQFKADYMSFCGVKLLGS